MDIGEAKGIIDDYLSRSIQYDIGVLGREHPHSCGETIGDIEKAYNILNENDILD